MDATKILTKEEILSVIADQKRRTSRNARQNLIIFRLSCCCGMRRKEIAGLDIGDIVFNTTRPCIRIRKEITKGEIAKRKARMIPLWWDRGTLVDLNEWVINLPSEDRNYPVVSSSDGQRITESSIARRWRTAIRCLGKERSKQLSIHSGRHSFCSHAIHGGRSLAEVRDAAGHSNINTTSIYLHAMDTGKVGDLFGRHDIRGGQ